MSLKFKGINLNTNDKEFSTKKVNLNFTIGIIKPHLVIKPEILNEIIKKILDEGFEFKYIFQRNLSNEELFNLYFKLRKESFFKDLINSNMLGDSIVFLLVHKNKKLDIINEWKKFIGNKDPLISKNENETNLRGLYGKDLIYNGFYGSDDEVDAEKNRKNFNFPIPQIEPKFKYDNYKVSYENLLKFLFPKNIEHFSINTRLDIFAKYGPVYNQHCLDNCFCNECHDWVEEYLNYLKLKKEKLERIKMGLEEDIENFDWEIFEDKKSFTKNLLEKKEKLKLNTKNNFDFKYKVSPIRLLPEDSIAKLWGYFCNKCIYHLENFTHLLSGRNNQHIINNLEIDNMIKDLNKKEILEVLKSEMGNGAKVIIEELDLTPPKQIEYNKNHVNKLFDILESDFYGRYDFEDLQKVILEDRRIRINYWVSLILKIPIEKIKLNKFIDLNAKTQELKNIKNQNFTLKRIKPLSMFIQKKNINEVPLSFMDFNFKAKEKYSKIEERYIFEKLLHRYGYKLFDPINKKKGDFKNCVYIIKDINEGRNSSWNNYCCLKGNKMESYIKYKSRFDVK